MSHEKAIHLARRLLAAVMDRWIQLQLIDADVTVTVTHFTSAFLVTSPILRAISSAVRRKTLLVSVMFPLSFLAPFYAK